MLNLLNYRIQRICFYDWRTKLYFFSNDITIPFVTFKNRTIIAFSFLNSSERRKNTLTKAVLNRHFTQCTVKMQYFFIWDSIYTLNRICIVKGYKHSV